jgi:shikimate kinase
MSNRANAPVKISSATPYHNLILTGHIGVGRVTVGRQIAKQVGVPFVDFDTEMQLREGMLPDEIRSLFGESRLRTLEDQLSGELSLRRGSVLSVGGPTLLDENNRRRFMTSGQVLILTCALNEILRRLHASQGGRFHDPKVRSASLYQIRRERQIEQMTAIPTLDTTKLSVEEVAEHAARFWREHDVLSA